MLLFFAVNELLGEDLVDFLRLIFGTSSDDIVETLPWKMGSGEQLLNTYA
jgi:hypothetical protein